MHRYKIKIHKEALLDIQEASDWYNMQGIGLGSRFQKQIKLQINSLKTEAMVFAVRYANIRCMTIKKYPFMVYYSANSDSKIVEIFAILHTSRNPKI